MTTHDDLETRLRASLRERADDVDTTPALYERVQRQASRGAWARRGLALAGAAAVVAGTFVVVPSLLPDPDIDIANTPEDAAPTPNVSEPPPGTVFSDPLLEANVAFADDAGRINVAYRVATAPSPPVSLAVSPLWTETDGVVAAGLQDGRIGVVEQSDAGGFALDLLVDAAANGGGVGFSPDGQAIAWIEGTDLHVLPLSTAPDGERVLPLQGDVPDDLVLEQWFYAADAQSILASDPAGGVWSIPMDDSDAFDSEPTSDAFLHPQASDADAVDAALLPDLSLVVLRVPGDGSPATLTVAGDSFVIDDVRDTSAELTTNGGSPTVFDPTTGLGTRWSFDVDSYDVVAQWEAPGITAVAPLPDAGDSGDSGDDTEPGPADASALGLPTDAPVIGTAGTDLLVRSDDGEVQTIAVYPAESEATLGRLAVRPGSTLDDGLVAVESFSEGENTIRFVALRGGEASPIGDVLVTDGPVTGLVWSEDGAQIAWTDTNVLHYGTVDDEGVVDGGGEVLTQDARPVLDWVWTDGDTAATGHLTVAVAGGTGVEQIEVERSHEQFVTVTGPGGGADRVVLDTHAAPGAGTVGPEVHATLGGGTAVLQWYADGDRTGDLPDPGQLGGDVRVEVSGGHVLVMGDSRQTLVTFDGEVTDLPPAADWDVLD